jgi:ASC-1-like (ASCH) protein
MKKHILKIAKDGKYIFDAIFSGEKKVETRAFSVKYNKIKVGDVLVFSCGKERFDKVVKKVENFKSIKALVKKYSPIKINPKCKTEKELEDMYYTFPDYKEKIKEFGLIAFTLE